MNKSTNNNNNKIDALLRNSSEDGKSDIGDNGGSIAYCLIWR